MPLAYATVALLAPDFNSQGAVTLSPPNAPTAM